MGVDFIFGFVIYFIVAAFMMGIGITQLRSKKPVGFYSGEEPPNEKDLTDVRVWNLKHGTMWVLYGVIILLSFGIGTVIGDSIWCVIPMCGGVMLPLPVMIWYHHRLIRIYDKRKNMNGR